ncbi:hypothetical protein BLOT_002255 [Blomia tropicalis]|nr:hypothetical protein BLOT_002255 [Blomia tropicalis]
MEQQTFKRHSNRYQMKMKNNNNNSLTNVLIIFIMIILLSAIGIIGGQQPMSVDAFHLTGVTLTPNHPRADVLNSFFHELIAEIASIGQFSYNLRTMPGAKYGGAVGETKPEGLIGEVYNKRADFVIADLEITDERKEFVEFTRPFMRSKLAVLMRRSSNQSLLPTDDKMSSSSSSSSLSSSNQTTLRSLMQQNKRAVVRGSLVEQYFRTSKNPYVYHLIPSTVPSLQAGIEMVNNSLDFILISDSIRLKLIAANDCHFMVVEPSDTSPNNGEIGLDFELEYAIGFQHDSPFLNHFDNALEQMESEGKLSALIDQHWIDYCSTTNFNDDKANHHVHSLVDDETNGLIERSSCSLTLILFSILISFIIW